MPSKRGNALTVVTEAKKKAVKRTQRALDRVKNPLMRDWEGPRETIEVTESEGHHKSEEVAPPLLHLSHTLTSAIVTSKKHNMTLRKRRAQIEYPPPRPSRAKRFPKNSCEVAQNSVVEPMEQIPREASESNATNTTHLLRAEWGMNECVGTAQETSHRTDLAKSSPTFVVQKKPPSLLPKKSSCLILRNRLICRRKVPARKNLLQHFEKYLKLNDTECVSEETSKRSTINAPKRTKKSTSSYCFKKKSKLVGKEAAALSFAEENINLKKTKAVSNPHLKTYVSPISLIQPVYAAALTTEYTRVNGIRNSGVSCFLNSILNCLAQSPLLLGSIFNTYGDNNVIELNGNPNEGVEPLEFNLRSWGPITHNLSKALAKIHSSSLSCDVIDVISLIQVLGYRKKINFHVQQDAQELLLFLFASLDDEYLEKIQLEVEEILTSRNNCNEFAHELYKQQAREQGFPPLTLFKGLVTSTISCPTFNTHLKKTEVFTTLSLPLSGSLDKCSVSKTEVMHRAENEEDNEEPRPQRECTTVYTCLQNLMKTQNIHDYKCVCGRINTGETQHKIETKVTQAPQILVLHLKRFEMDKENGIKKMNKSVAFPSHLDMTNFCDLQLKEEPDSCAYLLYGVIQHSGTATGGHYTAYVKVQHPRDLASGNLKSTSEWFELNDEQTTQTSEESVLCKQPYLLFYKKVN